MASILSLNNVTKFYGALRALDQVSFEVPEKSVFGILGPNGSGKTTLLGTVTDVLKASSGSYQWFGKAPEHDSRKRIGTLLETPNFFPYLSAWDNLCINAAVKGCEKGEVDRVLHLTGLSERAHSRFRTYSLGMKQRLALASAMLGNPPVIILDEPTNGLDPTGIADIRNLIREIGSAGKTVIMASHLLDEVEKVCTHVAILKKGVLLASGHVNEVLSTDAVIEIASSDIEKLHQAMANYPGVKSIRRVNGSLQLAVGDQVSEADINRYCFEHQVVLTRLHRINKSLERKFIELTKEAGLH